MRKVTARKVQSATWATRQLLQHVAGRARTAGRRAERAETPGRQEGLSVSVAHPGARSDVGDGLEAPVQGQVEAEAVRSVSSGWPSLPLLLGLGLPDRRRLLNVPPGERLKLSIPPGDRVFLRVPPSDLLLVCDRPRAGAAVAWLMSHFAPFLQWPFA